MSLIIDQSTFSSLQPAEFKHLTSRKSLKRAKTKAAHRRGSRKEGSNRGVWTDKSAAPVENIKFQKPFYQLSESASARCSLVALAPVLSPSVCTLSGSPLNKWSCMYYSTCGPTSGAGILVLTNLLGRVQGAMLSLPGPGALMVDVRAASFASLYV